MDEPIHENGAPGRTDSSRPTASERSDPPDPTRSLSLPEAALRTDAVAHVRPEGGTVATDEVVAKAAAGWLQQFARTLKTCRLYDAANPTVQRFRDELVHALDALLAEHGAITYRFLDDRVMVGEHEVHIARSREDHLAFTFHRDGVRALTFQPGVTEIGRAHV